MLFSKNPTVGPPLQLRPLLNAAAPCFVSRQLALFMQVFQSSVSDCGGLFTRASTDQTADTLRVSVEVSCSLARLRSKGDTLRKCRQVFAGGDSQRLHCGASTATGVGAGQSHSAPHVMVSCERKRVDRARDRRHV